MNPFEVKWSAAVAVHVPNGKDRRITGIQEALDLLENEWPTMHGECRHRAIAACKGVLRSESPIAVAREEFIAACIEQSLEIELEGSHQANGGLAP